MCFWWWGWLPPVVDVVRFAFDACTAISAKCHGTFCTATNRRHVSPPLRIHIGWESIAWLHAIYPFVSTKCCSTICIGRLSMDRHISWPIWVDRTISVQHVRHTNQMNRPKLKRHRQALTSMTSSFQFRFSPMWCEPPGSTYTKKSKSIPIRMLIEWDHSAHCLPLVINQISILRFSHRETHGRIELLQESVYASAKFVQ